MDDLFGCSLYRLTDAVEDDSNRSFRKRHLALQPTASAGFRHLYHFSMYGLISISYMHCQQLPTVLVLQALMVGAGSFFLVRLTLVKQVRG